ncbi:E3 ubiquitin-protein ligase RNF13-like [Limulus polyphemus]|uniref:E3 ubiquitin-protein ligase RNF13-like n=1 Tax=Limulus polyphemus TaxID=6850 RepID=A0ABM1BCC0_LIMPO|nr:E3 ubiquitin-protein ligase RNF13-like [Limulus polyphemus]XP_013779142.1 E3 ubiquitin-protein ligase RNF13-like [Limulus polyphemus]XP_013779144.1 E3 ubiquitin-protein ligase RNF13-like [Limulus polyphemus]XP_022246889.1 E3 ubiquitin-protein ligase RNF13-like [Limulus polyphemus]XP_022246891.1 E3 ubiquitin-protein ligase RNF13-like [Limulus polyphemus]XP_022246892.1 E3 ubiquitin-protein ligase RNF13-like [Limulus polyphemus]
MFPHCKMPSRVTVFYIYIVVSLVTLLHSTLVAAEIDVLSPENETIRVIFDLSITAPVPTRGIRGRIALAKPIHPCEHISKPPYPSNSTLKWFVLIETASCSMHQQVLIAEKAGYDAAVIYNKGIGGLRSIGARDKLSFATETTIPGVLIGEQDGNDIKHFYLYEKGYTLILYPELNFNLNTYLLPFAVIIGICFIIMVTFMLIKCINDRRHGQRNRLSSKHLKQLPVNKFKKGDPYDVCAICLEDFKEGEKLRMLPCSHSYHTKCVDPWLTDNRRTCPMCKRKVILDGHHSETDSDSDQDSTGETTPLLHTLSRGSNTIAGGGTFSEIMPTVRPTHIEETTQTIPVLPEQPGSFLTTQVELHNSTEVNIPEELTEPAPFHSLNGDELEEAAGRGHIQPRVTGAVSKRQPEVLV